MYSISKKSLESTISVAPTNSSDGNRFGSSEPRLKKPPLISNSNSSNIQPITEAAAAMQQLFGNHIPAANEDRSAVPPNLILSFTSNMSDDKHFAPPSIPLLSISHRRMSSSEQPIDEVNMVLR